MDTEPIHRAGDSRTDDGVSELQPGTFVARYKVLERLGAGGMGVVYRAHDEQLARDIALKVLSPTWHAIDDPGGMQIRLFREAQALAQLSHPNVVVVHDVGTFQHTVFIAMELVDGVSLRAWLGRARPSSEIMRVLIAAGRGLAAAHRAGVVHRDFKPENVMVSLDGRARVVDFGLARATSLDSDETAIPVKSRVRGTDPDDHIATVESKLLGRRLTQTGAILGTPGYMAPEQFDGVGSGAASDQFSYAATCFFALTGCSAHSFHTLDEYRDAVLVGSRVGWPRSVSRGVRRVIDRGLSVQPDARFPTLEDMVLAFERAAPQPRRWRTVAKVGLVLGVLGLAVWQSRTTVDACSFRDHPLVAHWAPSRVTAVRERMAATLDVPADERFGPLSARIEDYADRWQSFRRRACEATHVTREQSEDLYSLQTDCLDRSRERMGAFLAWLEQGDVQLFDDAIRTIDDLGTLEACEDTRALLGEVATLPDDPGAREALRAIDIELQQALAQEDAGRSEAALAMIDGLLARAEPLGHAPTLAHLLLERARVERSLNAVVEAERSLDRAMALAAPLSLDSLSTRIAAETVDFYAYENRLIEAQALVPYVEVGASRPGFPLRERAGLLLNHGKVLSEQFEFGAAERKIVEAIEIFRQTNSLSEYSAHTMLANQVYKLEGRFDDARASLTKALQLKEQLYGLYHPSRISTYFNLAALEAEAERPERALAALDEAQRLAARLKAASWTNDLLELEGYVRRLAGECDQAVRVYERAIAGYTATHGADSIRVAQCIREVGVCLERLGRHDEAVAALDQAVSILKTKGASISERINTLRQYAEVLYAGGDGVHALEVTEEALRLARTGGREASNTIAEIEAWLGSHGEAPGAK